MGKLAAEWAISDDGGFVDNRSDNGAFVITNEVLDAFVKGNPPTRLESTDPDLPPDGSAGYVEFQNADGSIDRQPIPKSGLAKNSGLSPIEEAILAGVGKDKKPPPRPAPNPPPQNADPRARRSASATSGKAGFQYDLFYTLRKYGGPERETVGPTNVMGPVAWEQYDGPRFEADNLEIQFNAYNGGGVKVVNGGVFTRYGAYFDYRAVHRPMPGDPPGDPYGSGENGPGKGRSPAGDAAEAGELSKGLPGYGGEGEADPAEGTPYSLDATQEQNTFGGGTGRTLKPRLGVNALQTEPGTGVSTLSDGSGKDPQVIAAGVEAAQAADLKKAAACNPCPELDLSELLLLLEEVQRLLEKVDREVGDFGA